jgi:predicted transcriptional regulator
MIVMLSSSQTRTQKPPIPILDETLQSSKRKRGWIEIIWLVLSQCIDGSVKTRIMYRCNLNSKQMQQYLSFLLDCRFLDGRRDPNHVTLSYFTTDLGLSFVEKYEQLQEVLDTAISKSRMVNPDQAYQETYEKVTP